MLPRMLILLRISGLLSLLVILSALLIGCATPGEPLERKPPVAAAISDLAAEQSGNDVILTSTLPDETIDHRALKHTPAIEIYRDFQTIPPAPIFAPPAATAASVPPSAQPASTLLLTIPAGVVDQYSEHSHMRYADALTAEDFARATGQFARYIVRTRASEKKDSANSNIATLQIYPAPDPIGDVNAQVTHSGITLVWTPPQSSPAGPAPAIAGYNIYRADAEPGGATNPENPQMKSPLVKIAESKSPTYQDTQAELGNTYIYSVRTLTQYPGKTVESADSKLAVVIARDTFPPAVPQGLVVVFVPAEGGAPAHVELSWAISPETDLAGYNVYRSGKAGVPGVRLNAELLPTPAFRDSSVVPGRQYIYSVTAVNRSGNESAASEAASGGVPAESQRPQ